ncbi:MAG: hypothetical protein KJT03_09535, partial [Verrucomicrobiae bacterium]|nr:hypothetical protein [Verrucomicrobiae bacterium]
MRLKTSYLFLTCFLLSCGQFLLKGQDFASDPFSATSSEEPAVGPSAAAQTEELNQLKGRLRQIESMLLAQKDRENELLRDLNRMLTVQDQTDTTQEVDQKQMRDMELRFLEEAATLQSKINSLELALAAGRERDRAMSDQMNKTLVITVSTVAGIGLIVFLVTVYLQYRLLSRPVQPIYMQPPPLALEARRPQLPVSEEEESPKSDTGLVENTKVEDANERFVSAIERLEARILHMENGLSKAQPNKSQSASNMDNGTRVTKSMEAKSSSIPADLEAETQAAIDKEVESIVSGSRDESEPESDEKDVAVLEEEGKRFLQKEDWETAFRHYDQLVRLDPDRVDNWVNRGRAL